MKHFWLGLGIVVWMSSAATADVALQFQYESFSPSAAKSNPSSFPDDTLKADGLFNSWIFTNVSVIEGETARFAVNLQGTLPISLQWFRDRKPIRGAQAASLTITNVQLEHHSELYTVVASNSLGQASAEVVLSVVPNSHPPIALGAFHLGGSNSIAVVFSKPVAPAAADPANFSINKGVRVKTATPGFKPEVILLNTSGVEPGETYKITLGAFAEKAEPLAVEKDLLLWLKCDAKTDTDMIEDFSGNNHFTSLIDGAALNENGMDGSCLELDGSNDYAMLPDGFADFTSGLTIALWAKPESSGLWARFIEFANGPSQNNILFARQDGTDNLAFEVYNPKILGKKVIAPRAIDRGVWQHFAVSMDGAGNVSLYKNGKLLIQDTTRIPEVIERKKNFIGRSNWEWDGYYKGCIDDVRVYKRPLSAAEIRALAGAFSQ